MQENTKTLGQLLEKLEQIIHVPDIDPDTPIGELGIDSLTMIEMILVCDQIFPGINVADADWLTQFTTLRQLDEHLAAMVESAQSLK